MDAAMLLTAMVVMYWVMFVGSWEWGHVRFSQSRIFMAVTMGGAIIGLIVATAVINLPKPIGILSGALGGFLGCGINYMLGFHPGVAAAGALIGFILAYMERTNRQAWLAARRQQGAPESLGHGAVNV